jgi:DNA replication protein DnaC
MRQGTGPQLAECPQCHGSTWKREKVPSKRDPARLREVAVRCDCYFAERSARLLKAAQIPARYANCTLSNFDIINRSLSTAVSDIQHFVNYYPIENMGLLLVGPVGVGKTHLAVAAIQYLIREKGIACLFCDYRELLKQIQNSYNPSVQTTELEILRPVFDAEVLLLDELGAIRPSEWVWDTVSHIINYRYNEKKTTIITTNFPDAPSRKEEAAIEKPEPSSRQRREAELVMREETLGDRITDRMYSRLHEMCRVIQMQGNDFRRLASAMGNASSLESHFSLQVIRAKAQVTDELYGRLDARSIETGVLWSSAELPWDQLCQRLAHLGLTRLDFEEIQSVLLRGERAEIGGMRNPINGMSTPRVVTEQQLRAMQMKPTTATRS